MPPSAPPRNDQLASNSIEAKWLVNQKKRFFELSITAFQWHPVNHTFSFTGVDPKSIYKITYGIASELDNTLHDIYAEHGPVDLHVCARDPEGRYYVKCSQNKYAPAKAIICVLQADEEKSGTAAKAPSPVLDEQVRDPEIWEDVVFDEVVEDDDWVKV